MERLEERRKELEGLGARLVALSVDPVERSRALIERLELGFPILSDEGGVVSRLWNAWQADRRVSLPAVFVVDREKRIRSRYVSRAIDEREDEEEIVETVKRAQSPSSR